MPGRCPPLRRSTVPVPVHLTPELADALEVFCKDTGRSRSEVMRSAVDDYLAKLRQTQEVG